MGAARIVDARVRDPVAEVTEPLRRVGRALVGVPLRDVADDSLEACAERIGRLAHGLLVAIEADHADAIGQQPLGDRAADADGRARHDRDVRGRFRRAHAGRISL